jgi:hypothetical protein
MAWLHGKRPREQQTPAEAGKPSFDVPVKLRVRGVAEPVQATLLHIAVAGARLRCWMMMERGSILSFEWRLADGRALQVGGTVAARYAPRNGGVGFEYGIALDKLPEQDADALAREAAMLQRRTASARSYDTSLVDISQFTGYRVPDDFSLTYRVDDRRSVTRIAQACDVTGNGLRMRCDERLREGQDILVSFRLPDEVLGVHKGSDEELVTGPFGYRRVPRRYLRRAFADLKLRARVIAAVTDSKRRGAYEVQFLNVDGLAREELARYIHASQLARLKR